MLALAVLIAGSGIMPFGKPLALVASDDGALAVLGFDLASNSGSDPLRSFPGSAATITDGISPECWALAVLDVDG